MDQKRAALRLGARAVGLAAALGWLGAASQATPQQLRDLEQARLSSVARLRAETGRQQAAEADEQRLAAARVASVTALRSLEQATAEAAATMDGLARRRAEGEARLDARAKDLAPLLPLIERLSLYPAETLLAVPAPPTRSLTGLLVLQGLARQLEVDALALRAEQAEVARLTQGMARQEQQLTSAQSAQAAEAAGLDRQIAAAQSRGREADDAVSVAARHAAEQAGQAETLRAALGQLDLSRKQDQARARADAASASHQRQDTAAAEARQRQVALTQPAGPGLGEARGQLGAPVVGTVVKAYGEPGDGGVATGISFGAPPAARVSAPCGGRVVFSAPFRSFGHLMIIDCGGGYHFVLAGLEQLDIAVGRPVQPGEPVGVMPAWDPRTPSARPLLYVELRDHGQAINPAPYLRGRP